MTPIDSIPHASSSGSNHNNGQKIISISPTNSTNPVNKESGLANDENTKVPPEDKQPRSGEECVVDKTIKVETTGQGPTNPVNKESGLVDKTGETTEEETTGQGPAR
jgi:hypothetical protein